MATGIVAPFDHRIGLAPPPQGLRNPAFLLIWLDRKRHRAHLQIEDHLLRDIGVSRHQAIEEARRWT